MQINHHHRHHFGEKMWHMEHGNELGLSTNLQIPCWW